MFQQLLEFTDETAVGSAPSGAGSGKAHVSVCHLQGGQGRKGWEANGEEGDLEHLHGQKSHIRSGGVSLQWVLAAFCELAGGMAHAGCWKQGREFSFALRTSLPNNICSLYLLQGVVQWRPDPANWSLLTTCSPLKLLQACWEEFADLHISHPHRLQVKQYHGPALDSVSLRGSKALKSSRSLCHTAFGIAQLESWKGSLNFFLMSNLNLHFLSLKPLLLVSSLQALVKSEPVYVWYLIRQGTKCCGLSASHRHIKNFLLGVGLLSQSCLRMGQWQ